jgi:hypothetical protein
MEALTTEARAVQKGVVQLHLVVGDEQIPILPTKILTLLTPHFPGSFARSLSNEYMIGFSSVDTLTEPFMVFQSQNFDVAFAGMLEWEQYMSPDLAPLFGSPVLNTRVPNGSNTVVGAHFTDALNSNRSIRILYDETGQERIVYAFVNKNLVIITTSTGALSRLIERIQ